VTHKIYPPEIIAKAAKIKCLICDVDGVFSDGQIYLSNSGEELKAFYVPDGQWIKYLLASGVEMAVITGRSSNLVQQRMEALGIRHIYQGQQDKMPAFKEILNKLNLQPEQVAYIGDDLPDLPLIHEAGLGITVPNAISFVQQRAAWQTQAAGGYGAIREVCELLLDSQNNLSTVLESYVGET
jgi:3-deoxy-D-manno-octulosonate 8-phosphate phosphatase (KDO 8-P phosphatase)